MGFNSYIPTLTSPIRTKPPGFRRSVGKTTFIVTLLNPTGF
nr:MAG TPA: hypothetical protein [Caudoviricetes sp.]